jgi:lysophospholipase L1-like esterase
MKIRFALTLSLVLLQVSLMSGADAPSESKQPAKVKQPTKVKKIDPAFAKITDDPKLPRVLLIGDSISIGYTVATQELLVGKANVHRIPTNGGPTTSGLANLNAWIGEGRWDVIHFNWGLHDLKYIDDKKQLASAENGRVQVPLDEYEKNLRELVARLKKTGAKLVWCTTTPVPAGATGRVEGDERKYNEAAAKIMKEQDVMIDDLGEFARPQLSKIQLPANVHFSDDGSRVLASKVAESILTALSK